MRPDHLRPVLAADPVRPVAGTIAAVLFLTLTLLPVATATATAPVPEHPAPVRITEVLTIPSGPHVGHQVVELINVSPEAVDLSGWRLWYQYQVVTVPAGTILPAGGIYLVHIAEDGVNDATNLYTGARYPALVKLWDSVALFGPSGLLTDPEAIVDFVQWGRANMPSESVAVAAGIWPDDGFVPAPDQERISMQVCGSLIGPPSWSLEFQTIGSGNLCTTPPVPVRTLSWGTLKSLH